MSIRRRIFTSTLVSFLALAVIVPVFLVASASVLRLIRTGYQVETEIRRAQELTSRLLVLQLDEETSIRGYINTKRRDFLDPYNAAVPEFADLTPRLEQALRDLGLPSAIDALHQIAALNEQWRATVSDPVMREHPPRSNVFRLVLGKQLIDEERAIVKQIADTLTTRESLAQQQTAAGFVRATFFAVIASLLIGGAILAFGVFRARYASELQRERSLIEKWQRAFIHRWEPLVGASVGTAYLSATQQALVGGDVFDVRSIDEAQGYVLVGDVSGKGIEAAVDTAFVKFTIRALAFQGGDPGAILTSFNRLVFGSLSNPDAFIVAFFGVIDTAHGVLRYASAGHSAAFLRRGAHVRQLPTTGAILGLSVHETFETQTVELEPDDLIVVATDGLTEARDEHSHMLTEEGAMQWVAESTAPSAQGIADELVRRLNRFVRAQRLDDDLALVVVRFRPKGVPSVLQAGVSRG